MTEEDAEAIGLGAGIVFKNIFSWIKSFFYKEEKKEDFKKKVEGGIEIYEYDPQFKNLRRRRHSD